MDGLSQIVATAASKVQKFTSTFFNKLLYTGQSLCVKYYYNCFFVCLFVMGGSTWSCVVNKIDYRWVITITIMDEFSFEVNENWW